MELDARMLITLGGMAASILTSAVVVRQKVAELEKSISALAEKAAMLDTNLDQNNVTTQTIQKAVDTLREINSPPQLREATRIQENHSVRITQIEGQTIPLIVERVSKLEKLHNGKHYGLVE